METAVVVLGRALNLNVRWDEGEGQNLRVSVGNACTGQGPVVFPYLDVANALDGTQGVEAMAVGCKDVELLLMSELRELAIMVRSLNDNLMTAIGLRIVETQRWVLIGNDFNLPVTRGGDAIDCFLGIIATEKAVLVEVLWGES
jgi:hypothetical protein